MDERRIDLAINRIESALDRLQSQISALQEEREQAGPEDAQLRQRVEAALGALDEVIAGLER